MPVFVQVYMYMLYVRKFLCVCAVCVGVSINSYADHYIYMLAILQLTQTTYTRLKVHFTAGEVPL